MNPTFFPEPGNIVSNPWWTAFIVTPLETTQLNPVSAPNGMPIREYRALCLIIEESINAPYDKPHYVRKIPARSNQIIYLHFQIPENKNVPRIFGHWRIVA